MFKTTLVLIACTLLTACGASFGASAEIQDGLKHETFDSDPGWEGNNNRLVPADGVPITKQDFGYRNGKVGGWVARSATPAWYAKPIAPLTFNDKITASGKFAVASNKGNSGVLFGFFNDSSRGWRSANSLVFRLDGNSRGYWVFFEYGTQHRYTGGGATFEGKRYQTTPTKPFPADGTVHEWTLSYNPDGANGLGKIDLMLDGKTYSCELQAGHKSDGATFNRFGILNVQNPGNGIEVYFSDLTINGKPEDLSNDPKWEGHGNEIEFPDRVRRPWHDFGFSITNNAGSKIGEIGGVIWRAGSPAYYADCVGPFTLDNPLHAEGKIAFTRSMADSGTCIGFFNARSKKDAAKLTEQDANEADQLGIFVEGPSRVGHYFRPFYFNHDRQGILLKDGPVILPDGQPHRWSLDYDPTGANGHGEITVNFDDHTQKLELNPKQRRTGASFDHFGLFNRHTGGSFVEVWLDDLKYSAIPVASK